VKSGECENCTANTLNIAIAKRVIITFDPSGFEKTMRPGFAISDHAGPPQDKKGRRVQKGNKGGIPMHHGNHGAETTD
jgi:hypothetical protein